MNEDSEEFFYPTVDEMLCIECGLCEKVCPVICVQKETPHQQDGYVVQNKNSEILRESTSGGTFTAIAEQIIAKGGAVFGVTLDDYLLPHHTWVETAYDLKKFRNSKYVKSYMVGRIS